MAAQRKLEWVDVTWEARQKLEKQGGGLPYRAIVVDETQDLHTEELRLLRQMVPSGANDLFLVGEPTSASMAGRWCCPNAASTSAGVPANCASTTEQRTRFATGPRSCWKISPSMI